MAMHQSDYKNVDSIKRAVTRDDVITELGAPKYSEKTPSGRTDIFSFRQGYSNGNKGARVFFHTVADMASLFLWEAVGTPSELLADGKNVKLEVYYNENDEVVGHKFLSGQESSNQTSTNKVEGGSL